MSPSVSWRKEMPTFVLQGVLSWENRVSRWIRINDPPDRLATTRSMGVDWLSGHDWNRLSPPAEQIGTLLFVNIIITVQVTS